jgi:hypothetical protein
MLFAAFPDLKNTIIFLFSLNYNIYYFYFKILKKISFFSNPSFLKSSSSIKFTYKLNGSLCFNSPSKKFKLGNHPFNTEIIE